MRADQVVLTHVRVPLVEPFRISSGAVAEKDGIVVEVRSGGLTGYGESSPMSGTFYSSDTPEKCWRDLRELLIPGLLGKSFATAREASEAVAALPGRNFSKVGIETAFWDIEAQERGKPLYALLGGEGRAVESGLAVGLYDDIGDLLRTIARYLTDGYKRVKIKIERGKDVELVRAVRQEFGDVPLFVDANGAYDLSDVGVFQQLDEFGLMMFEQPFAGGMLEESAELQRHVRTPVCLDESLETAADLQRAIELKSLQIGNIKIQRVGGFRNALEIYEIARENGIPVWMGTMPELGIGQAQGAHMATLSHCAFPTDVEASLRWFRDDIITPVLTVEDGLMHLPSKAGLGYGVDAAKVRQYTIASETFRS